MINIEKNCSHNHQLSSGVFGCFFGIHIRITTPRIFDSRLRCSKSWKRLKSRKNLKNLRTLNKTSNIKCWEMLKLNKYCEILTPVFHIKLKHCCSTAETKLRCIWIITMIMSRYWQYISIQIVKSFLQVIMCLNTFIFQMEIKLKLYLRHAFQVEKKKTQTIDSELSHVVWNNIPFLVMLTRLERIVYIIEVIGILPIEISSFSMQNRETINIYKKHSEYMPNFACLFHYLQFDFGILNFFLRDFISFFWINHTTIHVSTVQIILFCRNILEN